MRRTLRGFVAGLFLLLAASAARGQAKTLFWRAFDVRANLDSSGALHVVERQAMVFTGDWNGGERKFRLFPGQKLAFESVRRVDPATGQGRALEQGDLSAVDHYLWKDPQTLRWRSRRPSDPPFDKTEIVYELSYTLSGILLRRGDVYTLDNDFAFPEREGEIQSFSLDLSFDPAWKTQTPFPGKLARSHIPPGQGVVVTVSLTYAGAGKPVVGRSAALAWVRIAFFLFLAATTVALYVSFRRRESALGRFAPLPPPEAVDAKWLSANVFSLLPEEVGALWDGKVGPPEVAAVLARMAAEKKIEASASGKKLSMKLLVHREKLTDYEKELVDALFFGGREETDTDAIKEHYKSKGFDPAEKIKPGIEARLKAHRDFQDRSPRPARLPTALLIAAGVGLMILSLVFGQEEPGVFVGLLIFLMIVYAVGLVAAWSFQKRVDRVDPHSWSFLWVPALLLFVSYEEYRRGGNAGWLVLLGLLLLRLGIINNVLNVAKSREGPHKIARRKILAAARRFFRLELASRQPRLSDDWFPYLVALELGNRVDRWFRAYGQTGASVASTGRAAFGSPSSSSASSASSASWRARGGRCGAGLGRRRRGRGRRKLGRRRRRRLVSPGTSSFS